MDLIVINVQLIEQGLAQSKQHYLLKQCKFLRQDNYMQQLKVCDSVSELVRVPGC
jgi:hypothetical protein